MVSENKDRRNVLTCCGREENSGREQSLVQQQSTPRGALDLRTTVALLPFLYCAKHLTVTSEYNNEE